MTVSPHDSFTPDSLMPGTVTRGTAAARGVPTPSSPGVARSAAAAARREAALASLAARRMPLPGMPSAGPAHSDARSHTAPVCADPRAGTTRPHMRLVHNAEQVVDGTVSRPAPPRAAPRPATTAESTAHRTPGARNTDGDVAPERRRPGLTDREIQVLRTWLLTDSKIMVAQELCISIGTVNTHLTRIRAKYTAVDRSARTKAALAARAIQDGLLSLDEL
jgi:DNA-binding CsgD family transcriptional regulator